MISAGCMSATFYNLISIQTHLISGLVVANIKSDTNTLIGSASITLCCWWNSPLQ